MRLDLCWFSKSKTIILQSLVLLVASLALIASTSVDAHAASTTFQRTKIRVNTYSSLSKCRSWRVVPSANISSYSNILYGTAAVSANNVWAVGYYQDQNGTTGPTLIENWNGTQWHIIPSPNPTGPIYNILTGVAVVSKNDIWASGYSFSLDQNGSSYQTLIEHWDGTAWSVIPSPNVNGANSNLLYGIAVVSASDIWTVGYYQLTQISKPQTLIEQWNGTNWNIVSSPNSSSNVNLLTGITAISINDLWAVGYYGDSNGNGLTLIEHWDGTNWNIISSPNPGPSSNNLYGVASASISNVWAVGAYGDSNGIYQPLIENWNGKSWSVSPSANPSGSTGATLNGVAIVSKRNIWAVGYYGNSNGLDQTLIEQWNGKSWKVISSPNVGSSRNRLNGVAVVPGKSKAWAVGYYIGDSGYQTLTEFNC